MASTTRALRSGLGTRPPRSIGILAAALVLAATSYVAGAVPRGDEIEPTPSGGAATPGSPGGASAGLVEFTVEQIDRSITAWSANLAAEPRDFLSATNLASLYHGRAQLTGDLGDLERASAASETALALAPGYAPARALQASIRFSLHDFAGAFSAADSLYRDDPSQLGALATRADAQLELGRIDDARQDLEALAAAAPGPAVDVRLARLAFLTGSRDNAIRLALGARDAARALAPTTGTIDLPFYEFAAGEYARLTGDAETARSAYEAALALRPNDLGALVGLARIDAFDSRLDPAIEGLRRASAIAPQPETLAVLGDLLDSQGEGVEAARAFETVRFIARLGTIQGAVYDRLLLRFELDHGGADEAILDAARVSRADRPDAAGHDLLAWALYRLGRHDEAAAEIRAARADGADDARLRFHDGAIRVASGDRLAGDALLRAALADGPALDPIERAEAERLLRTP